MEIHWRDDLLMNALIPSLPSTPFTLLGVVGDSVRHVITSSSKRKSQSSHCRTHFVCVLRGIYWRLLYTRIQVQRQSSARQMTGNSTHTHPFFFFCRFLHHPSADGETEGEAHCDTFSSLFFPVTFILYFFFWLLLLLTPGSGGIPPHPQR